MKRPSTSAELEVEFMAQAQLSDYLYLMRNPNYSKIYRGKF